MNRILIVEDSPSQAHQLAGILGSHQRAVEIALDAEQGLSLFQTKDFDLVITDILLPGMSGYELCEKIKAHSTKADVPVILVTTLSDPMNIIKGLQCGANSFITKPYQANCLLARVGDILDKKAIRNNGQPRAGTDVIFQGKSLTITSGKEQILDFLIATFEDMVRTNQELQASKADLAAAKRKVDEYARMLEGQVRTTEDKRNRAEQALVESERRHRRLVEFSPDAIFIDRANRIVFANNPCLKLFGAATTEQVLGKSVFDFIQPEYHATLRERVRLLEAGRSVPLSEAKIKRFDGTFVDVEISASPFQEDGTPAMQVVCRDISDRKKLEEQFHHANKMEAVGKLAGGVAHDFNNLLTVITGYSDLLLIHSPDQDPMNECIREIQKAGERAKHLTRQLLAFSRKDVVEPRLLDLNALVTGTEKMLRRLIGEDITLTATLPPTLGRIRADAGQVEQVIVNLAVNARDAMPQGGRLTIETRDVELDIEYALRHPEVKPGRYVMLCVSDTGLGMSRETQSRIFEPFFTTKGPGQGTGLGLATVYGIVTQAGGHLEVHSELGRGTEFKIYLPAVDETPSPGTRSFHGTHPAPHGDETILLVEDEDAVRKTTKVTLQSLGYTVLEARNGVEALRLCERYREPIHLAITDVVMPEMSGRQVAERLSKLRPLTKVLFLSGYTDDAVVRHGILQAEVAFLQKPFSVTALARKVRDVLNQSSAPTKDFVSSRSGEPSRTGASLLAAPTDR
jgi:two-component system cell cycle sensor histidine kinase/response regulator CckA